MSPAEFVERTAARMSARLADAVRYAEANDAIPYAYSLTATEARAHDIRTGDVIAALPRARVLDLAKLLNRRKGRYLVADSSHHDADGAPVTVDWLVERHRQYAAAHVAEFGV